MNPDKIAASPLAIFLAIYYVPVELKPYAEEIVAFVLYKICDGQIHKASDWFKSHSKEDYEKIRLMEALS